MHWNIRDVGLPDTDFQSAVFKYVKRAKENIPQELKGSLRMIPHWIENISKDVEIIKKESNEMLELKTTITETKISLGID